MMKHANTSQRLSILPAVVLTILTLVLHHHHHHQSVVVVTTVLTHYGSPMLVATPAVLESRIFRYKKKVFLKNKHVVELPMKSSR
jgi:hypothetical protein